MKLTTKIAQLNFAIKNKIFQIYNDGILRAPRRWWQYIYIIYHWTIFEQVLFLVNFGVSVGIGIYSLIYPEFVQAKTISLDYIIAIISLVGNISDVMSIILSSKKRISTFAWGVIACSTLGATSFLMGTIGTGIVYAIVQLPMQFFGFYLWRRQSVNKIIVKPKRMKWWVISLTIALIIISTTGFYFLEKLPNFQHFWNPSESQTNAIALISDSLILILGVAGMILMVMAYKEQWIIWIILDIAMIILFSINLNFQIIALGATSLINGIYGAWNWLRDAPLKDYE
jgi:nicotinamide mononucleotide transporter